MSRVIAHPARPGQARRRTRRGAWRPVEAIGLIAAGLTLLVIGTALSVADAIDASLAEFPRQHLD
ncbi:hypothetical protein M446_2764 [Methylobacterium sp. 4-46]|uniref:hypothetical protein n=1 Tax=unclassified Methylobacterium TaxID=2615210 RepID=UPI000165C842|nr:MULTISPECIES: hypothetical protein [Methylobacterium]ACA17202.1 hypothetical protein M446_2764 [Methylobacterium sp. 4-46]WFT82884.1 hypothetical protein QA634_14005 [Methylobacterium nodulans]